MFLINDLFFSFIIDQSALLAQTLIRLNVRVANPDTVELSGGLEVRVQK